MMSRVDPVEPIPIDGIVALLGGQGCEKNVAARVVQGSKFKEFKAENVLSGL
jgi:hypothetical protein